MTEKQWTNLISVLKGEIIKPLPVGFIIDSPWLPNWYGVKILDYLTSEQIWFDANLKAVETFPDSIFIPGFWAEFGMATEPSAFGCKFGFPDNEFPFVKGIIKSLDEANSLELPNPKTDGLLPFVVNRLRRFQPYIEKAGHQIKFAVSRGPLNIATFLMGTTNFLLAMKINPIQTHKFLSLITDFIGDWLEYQKELFHSIDGVLVLDDIVGFLGEEDFKEFAFPYLKSIYGKINFTVKAFHNDAECKVSAPYLKEIGMNLFNMGIQYNLKDIRKWTQGELTLMGNIPPRDILAQGSEEDVRNAVEQQFNSLESTKRILFSCGGGMSPGTPTKNIEVFINKVKEASGR